MIPNDSQWELFPTPRDPVQRFSENSSNLVSGSFPKLATCNLTMYVYLETLITSITPTELYTKVEHSFPFKTRDGEPV